MKKHFGLLFFLLGLNVLWSQNRPNVIFILADDLCLGDLSHFNPEYTNTPHIDQLIERGVWFDQAYSASAVCAPARAALLTGKYPHSTGVVSLNMEDYPQYTHLDPRFHTLGDVFQENGYYTGLIGKWHLGFGNGYHPMDRGFHEFKGFLGFDIDTYFKYQLDINRKYQSFDGPYLTEVLTKYAVQFIEENQNQPFLLKLAHYTPHRPLSAPQDLIDAYVAKGLDQNTATIYAMVEIMDRGIGQLLDKLEELNLLENTIVIFASDNGPDPIPGQRFNLNLTGEKYAVNEGGIRIPFIFNWKDQWQQKKVSEVVHFVDVVPTLMELCQLKSERIGTLDGVSFAPLLQENGVYSAPNYRCWQWNRGVPMYSHNAALRIDNWKLVRPFVTRGLPRGESELEPKLYDISQDPSEEHDVSSEHPRVYNRLKVMLEDWCRKMEHKRLKLY